VTMLPLDYLAGFLLPGVLLLAAAARWLITRDHVRGRDLAPAVVLLLLLQPLVLSSTNAAGDQAKEGIFANLSAFAPTYAREMAEMGHASLTLDTPMDEPAYLRMIEAEKRWLEENPTAADIYTFRIFGDGRIAYLVDAETDYDGNGVIEGEREERTRIGEPMVTDSPAPLREAMRGRPVVDDEVEEDRWGTWVSTYAPIPGADGRPEALLGIDYHAETYLAAVATARRRALATGAVLTATLLSMALVIALLRRNVADREERNVRLDAAAREVNCLNADLERRIAERTSQLERANRELATFAYTVSHDLRTPLRSIEGFASQVLDRDRDRLAPESREDLGRVQKAGRHMGTLIDDILLLSRVTRGELRREKVDLTALALRIGDELGQRDPGRKVDLQVEPRLEVCADSRLVHVLMSNLLGNAWKYTGRREQARVEVGRRSDGTFFVRDNGCGFDMHLVGKLFQPFQRLHADSDFEGNGIGLATVARVVERHGGRVAAEGWPDAGCLVSFTLGEDAGG